MKKIVLFALLLSGLMASGQSIGYLRYDTVVVTKVGGNGELKILNATRNVKGVFTNVSGTGVGQWVKSRVSGDTIFVGADTLLVAGGVNPFNGLNNYTQGIGLGGGLDTITHLKIPNNARTGTTEDNHPLVISNTDPDSSFFNEVYDIEAPYNPAMLQVWGRRGEYRNDTLALQYGGAMKTFTRMEYDSNSTRFTAGNKKLFVPYQGLYATSAVFPPRDSVDWQVSLDGGTGSPFAAAYDLGDFPGYNVNIQNYPLSVYKSSVDFVRRIDNSRRKKMSGYGMSGFFSTYKLYQNTINSGTYEVGNRVSVFNHFDVYGDLYPNIGGGATKEKILAVSRIDKVNGLLIRPIYNQYNQVYEGYAINQEGTRDWNRFKGLTRIGGPDPSRETGDTIRRVLEVFGASRWQGDILMYADPVGTSFGQFIAAVNGYIKDTSRRQWALGSDLSLARDSRTAFITVGDGYQYSEYPEEALGMNFEIRTGYNADNVSKFWRNGSVTLGAGPYYLQNKLAVGGNAKILDTLRVGKVPLITDKTSRFVVMYNPNDSTLLRIHPDSIGTGGGGGSAQGLQSILDTDPDLTSSHVSDFNNNSWGLQNVNSFGVYDDAGTTRRIFINSTESSIYGPDGTTGIEARDSVYITAPTVTDTTGVYPLGQTPTGATVRLNGWPVGSGGGTPAGSNTELQYNNSGAFGASSNLTFNGSILNVGATESNYTPHYNLQGSGNRAGAIGLGAADHIYIQNNHSSNAAAGIVFRNRTATTIATISNTFTTFPYSLYANSIGGDYDSRISGDNDVNLIYADASVDNVGVGTSTPTSKLTVSGSLALAISTITSAATLDKTHHTILADATSGAITVNLPAASTATGRIYVVKKIDVSGNHITIDGNGTETIDGGTTLVITTQNDGVNIQSNGTAWFVISTF